MCLNGWGGKEYARLLPYLAKSQPDILCLQEVVHTPNAPGPWLEYRDGDHILPQRAQFFADVCAVLPDHVAQFCPAAQGVLWNGDTEFASQWGLATFVHRRHTIIGQIQGFVHKDFGPNGYGDHPRSRSAHGVRIWDFDAGRGLSVVHMHGLRDLEGKGDTPQRAKQAEKFADMTTRLAQPGDGIVACGDFNVLPGSATFDVLGRIGLKDLVIGRGFETTRTQLYQKPAKFADYLLVNDVLHDAPFTVVHDPVVSDHCPLVVTV
ncbi:MAG: endonuclease/exonuclease/phosphatase family protein [Pseudomonadota bacterium]